MNIYVVPMGITRCYIIQNKGTILIDSGPPNQLHKFTSRVREMGIDPKEIKLIINTHGHFDHIGSATDIKHTTGAQIAMHELDKECLEDSVNRAITGVNTWGRILAWLSARISLSQIPTTKVDIVLGDDEFSLTPFGISGRILHTPGHTMGSVSVLLDTGYAFVGDLAMNGFPFHFGPGLSLFAEAPELVRKSLRLLLDQGARVIYPGHGKPCQVDTLRRLI
ncbi:MAG TPA: MBL fold metallo-hydrolase [Dehalococcoidia bacterium]|nr:MBL fold metallo-hydrolase [Dehalococcoidia bacterium]